MNPTALLAPSWCVRSFESMRSLKIKIGRFWYVIYSVEELGFTYVSTSCSQADWLIGLLSDCAVTGVYAYRVWKLSSAFKYAVVIIVAMTMLSLGTLRGAESLSTSSERDRTWGLVVGIAFFTVALGHTYEEFSTRFAWLYYMTFSSQFITDVVITTSMCKTLYQLRTGIRRTDSILNVLMAYTVNTCALTSLLRIGSIFAFAFGQGTFAFVLVPSLLPRSIFSSLLALLNSRHVKQDDDASELVSIHLSKLRGKSVKASADAHASRMVMVETVTDEVIDVSGPVQGEAAMTWHWSSEDIMICISAVGMPAIPVCRYSPTIERVQGFPTRIYRTSASSVDYMPTHRCTNCRWQSSKDLTTGHSKSRWHSLDGMILKRQIAAFDDTQLWHRTRTSRAVVIDLRSRSCREKILLHFRVNVWRIQQIAHAMWHTAEPSHNPTRSESEHRVDI
ncbi:hypothetical protein NM688_g4996 [Phlebia brevispora]|uniref:Uncharacterized protein n=1 Tax=Phlebia brevispora TaxID=194682 RepID=A0ACC1T132_9APHY|nr:hypothetical protein NM688_g4996 [Phlebia brevispora]